LKGSLFEILKEELVEIEKTDPCVETSSAPLNVIITKKLTLSTEI
jgi:hypothetical protein